MIFRIFLFLVMAFFGYLEINFLMSDTLTHGEKLSSLVVFLLVEALYFCALITL
jgi:hypothetical protein